MDAPGHDKDYYEFVKQHRLRNKSNHNDMKQKLEYEKIESSDDSLRHLKFEPKANLKPVIEPKPILIIYIPTGMFHEYSIKVQMIERIQSALRDSGWLGIVFESEEKEVKVQSFTLKDSQTIEIEALKQTILKEIKGK